jgi:hypothetical protein
MRLVLSTVLFLTLSSGVAYAQFEDNDEGLFESEAQVDEPTDDQLNIDLGGDQGAKDVETEDVTEETLCCQMPESERVGDDLCADVTCP